MFISLNHNKINAKNIRDMSEFLKKTKNKGKDVFIQLRKRLPCFFQSSLLLCVIFFLIIEALTELMLFHPRCRNIV